jgi:hypothetical protein
MKTPPPELPDVDTALALLRRRHLLLVGALLARLICAAILSALLAPRLSSLRGLLDVFLIVLIVWPLYTGLGRLYSWRIALGRAYLGQDLVGDAARILAPLAAHPRRALLFDASGEGGKLYLSAIEASHGEESVS